MARALNHPFKSLPSGGTHLYVLELSDGRIKVGRSNSLRQRISLLTAELRRNRIGHIVRINFAQVEKRQVVERETELIRAMGGQGKSLTPRGEYFTGADFTKAVATMDQIAHRSRFAQPDQSGVEDGEPSVSFVDLVSHGLDFAHASHSTPHN